MANRSRPICGVRESALGLDAPTEWSLVYWQGLGVEGMGCDSPDDMAAAWTTHRDRILPHFNKQCPGLRPFAMFALGEVPLPPMVHKPYPNDTPFKSVVGPIYEDRCYGGYEFIFHHLKNLDILTKNEIQAAERFFDENPLRSPFGDYDMLTAQP